MSIIPIYIILKCTIKTESFENSVSLFLASFTHAGIPQIERWSIPSELTMKPGKAKDVLNFLEKKSPLKGASDGAFDIDGGIQAGIWNDRDDYYCLDIRLVVNEVRYEEMLVFIAKATEICRFLLKQDCLLEAALIRDGGGLSSTPDVPLIHTTSHVTIVTEQQVQNSYEIPEAFWDAGWDSVESFGEKHLLTRGLDILEGPDYLAKILPHQWAMARAAKPGLTKYYLPQVEPEERKIYKTGSPTLSTVGHRSGENLIELTCVLDPGQHINGWEIFDLLNLLQTGELPDGRKVEVIRVVFLECATASQEKRPLLDIGVKVFCYNDSGELSEFAE